MMEKISLQREERTEVLTIANNISKKRKAVCLSGECLLETYNHSSRTRREDVVQGIVDLFLHLLLLPIKYFFIPKKDLSLLSKKLAK
jgi:hypothetical protein